MALNQVSGVPAGVLRVISYVILTYTRIFSNQEPIPFSKAHALSYDQHRKSLGMIFRFIFAENGHFPKAHPLRYLGMIRSSFSGTGWGAKGESIRWIFGPNPGPLILPKGDFIRYSYLYP